MGGWEEDERSRGETGGLHLVFIYVCSPACALGGGTRGSGKEAKADHQPNPARVTEPPELHRPWLADLTSSPLATTCYFSCVKC